MLKRRNIHSAFICFIFGFITVANAQQRVDGFIYDDQGDPLDHASVISNRKGIGSFTDSSGKYSFWFPRQVRNRDSVTISAIGHESLTISLKHLLENNDIKLSRTENNLENVIVVSTLKGNPLRMAYYRGWNVRNTGGEIGQVVELPKKNLTLGSVQLKINQNYDTCWLKLHIRSVGGMLPEEDLLKEEIIVPATVKYGIMEFDLDDKNIKLPSRNIYVGFEVITCHTPQSSVPSFSFMGSEEGENLFRDAPGMSWQVSDRYTIYIRLLLK